MANVNTIDAIGDEALVDLIFSGEITEFYADYDISLGTYALIYCPSIETVDLSRCSELGSFALYKCSLLKSLVLRGETNTSLANKNALDGTPIKSGTGYIYVPAALIDSYKAATNWSTYADQFRALEDYTVDGTVTGELDETKI